jgi:hypothetical protein
MAARLEDSGSANVSRNFTTMAASAVYDSVLWLAPSLVQKDALRLLLRLGVTVDRLGS